MLVGLELVCNRGVDKLSVNLILTNGAMNPPDFFAGFDFALDRATPVFVGNRAPIEKPVPPGHGLNLIVFGGTDC